MFKLLNDDIALLDEKSSEDVFVKISRSVSGLIWNSGSRFSIGIYGEWGTGKTTLMKMIENKLNSLSGEDIMKLDWNKLVKNDSGEVSNLKEFLKNQYKVSWTEDSELFYDEHSKSLTMYDRAVGYERSVNISKRRKFSFLS